MAKGTGKVIDIPKDVKRGIALLAAMNDTDPKNYIQDLLASHVDEKIKEGVLNQSVLNK